MALLERVHMPSFAGATEWLKSEPLGRAELRGRVDIPGPDGEEEIDATDERGRRS